MLVSVRQRTRTLSAVSTTFVGVGDSSRFHVPSKQKTSRFKVGTPVLILHRSCAERAHAVLTVTLRLAVDASISEQRQLGAQEKRFSPAR